MTCIAALVDSKGAAHIASDTLGSNSWTKDCYRAPKIFARDGFLFGYAGSYRMGQVLQYKLHIPPAKVGQDLDTYMHTDFIDSVEQSFKDASVDSPRGTFLVVVEQRIFQVQSDLSLLESVDPFDSVGSGEDYARAAMRTMFDLGQTNGKKILTQAIRTAAHYVQSVGGDINYIKVKYDE